MRKHRAILARCMAACMLLHTLSWGGLPAFAASKKQGMVSPEPAVFQEDELEWEDEKASPVRSWKG